MLRTFMKLVIPCVLVLAVLITAFSLERITKKNPGITQEENKSQEQMAAQYGEPEMPQVTETQEQTLPPETTAPVETLPAERRYTLTFAGDCTLGSSPSAYYAQVGFVKTVGEDYAYPFANVISYFENDDFSFVNLEGPLCDEGYPVSQSYSFHGPTDFVNILTENSVEAVTLANNHTMDYGESGYSTTLDVLKNAGIPYVEQDSSTIITLEDGLTIGIYGSTYSKVDKTDMVSEIEAMKQQGVNVIVYAPHWGTENSYEPTAEQTELAHAAIDAGAHIVCGSHPHVLQPVEEYNGGVIYYSMGNFSFGGNGAPKDFDTAIMQQEIILGSDGIVTLGQRTAIPCSVSSVPLVNNFQPTPYEEGSAEYQRVMQKLEGTF